MCMCTVLLLTMVQVLYLLEVFILAHYVSPSTETPTTETTTVPCHKNSWIYSTSTYYWWLLRPTITIRFEMKKTYSHSTRANTQTDRQRERQTDKTDHRWDHNDHTHTHTHTETEGTVQSRTLRQTDRDVEWVSTFLLAHQHKIGHSAP